MEFALEPRSIEHQRQVSPQTTTSCMDSCTATAGSQTAPLESPASRHRASQCPDASDPRFCRLDVGTAMDMRTVADKFTTMDITTDGPQTALSPPRASAALSGLPGPEVGPDVAEAVQHITDVSSPGLVLASEAVGATNRVRSESSTEAAQPVTAITTSVQTEQPASVSTASASSLSIHAALALVTRQLVTTAGPAQPLHVNKCSAAVQTVTAEAAVIAKDFGAAQMACGSADTLLQPAQPRAAADGEEPADCLQISSVTPPVVTATQQLTLSDMEAAAVQHPCPRQKPPPAMRISDSSGIIPDNPPAAGDVSPVPSTTASFLTGGPEPSIPGTPRRNIHRRLWRSGRTSEWADLFARAAEDDRAHSSSQASSAPGSQVSIDDLEWSCRGATTITTSSDSMSSSATSHGSSSVSGVPLLRTAACQTSDAALSGSTTDDTDMCMLWDCETEAPSCVDPSMHPHTFARR